MFSCFIYPEIPMTRMFSVLLRYLPESRWHPCLLESQINLFLTVSVTWACWGKLRSDVLSPREPPAFAFIIRSVPLLSKRGSCLPFVIFQFRAIFSPTPFLLTKYIVPSPAVADLPSGCLSSGVLPEGPPSVFHLVSALFPIVEYLKSNFC